MISLLLLSMVLSTPSAATQTAVVASDSPAVAPRPLVLVHPGLSQQVVHEEQVRSFDPMEIRPEGDICFKIRAYIFSTGPDPKLLRETTCGPKRPTAKSVGGTKPKLVPVDSEDQPVVPPER